LIVEYVLCVVLWPKRAFSSSIENPAGFSFNNSNSLSVLLTNSAMIPPFLVMFPSDGQGIKQEIKNG
jgi:hypothetical protein